MKVVNNLPYHSVALCGYRQQGRKIYQQLSQRGIHIPYIIERNYQSLSLLEENLDVEIVGFERAPEFYAQAEVILLTGDLPETIIREALEFAKIEVPIVIDIEV
ncbi:MAG: hypothetical protein ACI4DK_15185 [Lachnospiraceae bacterium]